MNPGNVTGVGIDLILVERIASHLEDFRFLERVFTSNELSRNLKKRNAAESLSGCWAAKEATAKALGCGIGKELTWQEIEVGRSESGAPVIQLSETASERFGSPSLMVSISHDGPYAVAIVLRTE